MATPMTPDQALAAFRKEGLPVVEIPGWRTNDRGPATGRPSGPKVGNVNHHTGGDTSDPLKYASSVLFSGYSGLPGPLCHQGLDPDRGVLYMVGTGRTNHAGGGDPAVLAAVKAETVPYDRELKPTKGNTDGVDGNGPFYGIEVMYSGARDVPRVGYVAMVKWNTAICRFHGWTGASCIGHREWSDDKPDPGHVNLPQLRRDVDAALALPPGVWGSSTPPPSEEDEMTPELQKALSDIQASADLAKTRGEQTVNAAKYIMENQMPGLAASVASLSETVAKLTAANDNVETVTAEDIERWIKEGVAESVQVTGTLTVEPTGTTTLRSLDAPSGDAAPDCAEPSEHNV